MVTDHNSKRDIPEEIQHSDSDGLIDPPNHEAPTHKSNQPKLHPEPDWSKPLVPTPHAPGRSRDSWLAKARADAEALTPKIVKAWQKDGGAMRGEREIGELAIANGFHFSPKIDKQNQFLKEYEAHGTTSKWERDLYNARNRAIKNRYPELKGPKKQRQIRRKTYPGYDVDFGDKPVTKYARKQWADHVAAHPNDQGILDIHTMRHWIRQTEWFFKHDYETQNPVYQRYYAELCRVRGMDPELKNKVIIDIWGEEVKVKWVPPEVSWYADITKTAPLGALPARFKAYYEDILDDFRRSNGHNILPDPMPSLNELVPISNGMLEWDDLEMITDDEDEMITDDEWEED